MNVLCKDTFLRRCLENLSGLARRHLLNNLHRFHADGADAAQQVDDVFLVIGEAVVVELFADGGVAGFALFVAV